MNDFSRRDLLKGGGMIAVGLIAPRWLSGVARADMIRGVEGRLPKDTVLVVCQLSGGNDGLNTVVPYANNRYREFRPNIAHEEGKLLKLSETMALHPSLTGLKTLYDEGKVAIVQNVGYPKSNRSHFRAMEIWQSAVPEGKSTTGWLGRFLDGQNAAHGTLNPVCALGLSTERPLSLAGNEVSVPCFASLADVESLVGNADTERMLRQIQGMDGSNGSSTQEVQRANKSALDAVSILKEKTANYKSSATYGTDAFGRGFAQIGQLIATCPATRVIYFSTGGFDTHANQKVQHGRLMENLGNAILNFQREMEAVGRADKVVVMVFSEFGRRVQENASQGTDHGKAGPMFLIGSRIKGGLKGPDPDLQNLADGDIQMTQDFRGVYAASLDDWLGAESGTILGGKFDAPPMFG